MGTVEVHAVSTLVFKIPLPHHD